nr:hypothetical protein [Entomoplasma sp. MP1]
MNLQSKHRKSKISKRIAETIIKEITESNKFDLSITELAEVSKASQPTTTRFINELTLKEITNF